MLYEENFFFYSQNTKVLLLNHVNVKFGIFFVKIDKLADPLMHL
jgi:hypothetical protein